MKLLQVMGNGRLGKIHKGTHRAYIHGPLLNFAHNENSRAVAKGAETPGAFSLFF